MRGGTGLPGRLSAARPMPNWRRSAGVLAGASTSVDPRPGDFPGRATADPEPETELEIM